MSGSICMTGVRFGALVSILSILSCVNQRDASVAGPNLAKGGGSSDPTVTSTDPPGTKQNITLDVRVFGTGCDRGSNASFARDGIVDPKLHVNSTSYVSSGELVANLTVAAD